MPEPTAPPASPEVAPAAALAVRRNPAAGLAAVGAGAVVALALPPWGWWPLAFVGLVALDRLVADRPARSRAARTFLFALGWLAPGMGWMWFLTAPGYVVASCLYASYFAAAAALAPGGRWRALGLPAAFTLAEALRFAFPFGGVPLASLGIAQVAGPLAGVARVGGALAISWVTVAIAVALSTLLRALVARVTGKRSRPEARPSVIALAMGAVGVLVAVAAVVAPDGGTPQGTLKLAMVQGGGPQGTRAVDSNPRDVVERHLAATRLLEPGADLVLWPENVIDVDEFYSSRERVEVAEQAARLGAPVSVGVTEDAGPDHYLNAQIVVLPDGTMSSRYDKVKRVPFGEYMPMRSLLKALGAPTDLVPRDATPGTDPAVLDTPAGRVGVVISWEVFFGSRARDAISNGGVVLTNPTNGSSYTGTILQSQQVASSRLRAIETGRWVAQTSPTGFSAFVTPGGRVLDRTSVSEQAVLQRSVDRLSGITIYVRFGDRPIVLAAALVLAASIILDQRDRRIRRPAPP